MKVLILSGVQGDTRRYRTFHLYEQLRLAGVDCTLSHLAFPGIQTQAERSDILVFHRISADRVSLRLLERARLRGATVLLDVDDLVFDPQVFRWIDSPDFSDPTRAHLYQDNMRRSREILDGCDAVLASTAYLAEHIRTLGKPVWIHRNGFSLEMLFYAKLAMETHAISPDPTIIGYASGTRTHDQDFSLVRPALQRILRSYPAVELRLIGRLDPGPGWDAVSSQVKLLPFVPWRMLPGIQAGLDINLAPLRTDNAFCQSKSEIKYMEAAMVGVPTIASPTDAFAHAIRAGENGSLAAGEEEWESLLQKWIGEPARRKEIGRAAYQDCLEQFAPWVRARQISQTLNEIAAHLGCSWVLPQSLPLALSNQERRDLWVPPAFEIHPSLLERAFYTLRARDVQTLAQELWVYLRRLLEPVLPYQPRS